MAGFTYKIESGVPIVSSEVRQNFEDLQGVVNNLKDRNFEHGAINTRHLNGNGPPTSAAGELILASEGAYLTAEEFYLGNARPVKRIGYNGVGGFAEDSATFVEASEIGRASLDTRGLAGSRGFTLVAIAHIAINDIFSTGASFTNFAASEDVHISFKLQYERLEGVFVDFAGGGSDHSVRKVTLGSALRRADQVVASTFGIARITEGEPDGLHVRLMAIVRPTLPSSASISNDYNVGATIQVFGGLR